MQRRAPIAVAGVKVSLGCGKLFNFCDVAFLCSRMQAGVGRCLRRGRRELRRGRIGSKSCDAVDD